MRVDINDLDAKLVIVFNQEKKKIIEYVSEVDNVDAILVNVQFEIDFTELISEED